MLSQISRLARLLVIIKERASLGFWLVLLSVLIKAMVK